MTTQRFFSGRASPITSDDLLFITPLGFGKKKAVASLVKPAGKLIKPAGKFALKAIKPVAKFVGKSIIGKNIQQTVLKTGGLIGGAGLLVGLGTGGIISGVKRLFGSSKSTGEIITGKKPFPSIIPKIPKFPSINFPPIPKEITIGLGAASLAALAGLAAGLRKKGGKLPPLPTNIMPSGQNDTPIGAVIPPEKPIERPRTPKINVRVSNPIHLTNVIQTQNI